MTWTSFRFFALSVVVAPVALSAAEPRIIVPSKVSPKIVFERDDAAYDVLDKFRNARSSEQVHFQAIETLFPPKPESASVRRGYNMVKELVDAKKAATEAAARLEEERGRLEAARIELETQQVEKDKWTEELEEEAREFDYYDFEEPQPEPQKVVHHRHNHHGHAQQSKQNVHRRHHAQAKKAPSRNTFKRGARTFRGLLR